MFMCKQDTTVELIVAHMIHFVFFWYMRGGHRENMILLQGLAQQL